MLGMAGYILRGSIIIQGILAGTRQIFYQEKETKVCEEDRTKKPEYSSIMRDRSAGGVMSTSGSRIGIASVRRPTAVMFTLFEYLPVAPFLKPFTIFRRKNNTTRYAAHTPHHSLSSSTSEGTLIPSPTSPIFDQTDASTLFSCSPITTRFRDKLQEVITNGFRSGIEPEYLQAQYEHDMKARCQAEVREEWEARVKDIHDMHDIEVENLKQERAVDIESLEAEYEEVLEARENTHNQAICELEWDLRTSTQLERDAQRSLQNLAKEYAMKDVLLQEKEAKITEMATLLATAYNENRTLLETLRNKETPQILQADYDEYRKLSKSLVEATRENALLKDNLKETQDRLDRGKSYLFVVERQWKTDAAQLQQALLADLSKACHVEQRKEEGEEIDRLRVQLQNSRDEVKYLYAVRNKSEEYLNAYDQKHMAMVNAANSRFIKLQQEVNDGKLALARATNGAKALIENLIKQHNTALQRARDEAGAHLSELYKALDEQRARAEDAYENAQQDMDNSAEFRIQAYSVISELRTQLHSREELLLQRGMAFDRDASREVNCRVVHFLQNGDSIEARDTSEIERPGSDEQEASAENSDAIVNERVIGEGQFHQEAEGSLTPPLEIQPIQAEFTFRSRGLLEDATTAGNLHPEIDLEGKEASGDTSPHSSADCPIKSQDLTDSQSKGKDHVTGYSLVRSPVVRPELTSNEKTRKRRAERKAAGARRKKAATGETQSA